jgi:capsid protein
MASGRINTNEDNKTYKQIQKWFAKTVCQKEWNEYVYRMFLNDKIPGHKISDYLGNPWKYNQVQWKTPGFSLIDPSKEANAAIDLVNSNMKTLEDWYGERGLDWQDALSQRKQENEWLKNNGLGDKNGYSYNRGSREDEEAEEEEYGEEE